MFCSGLCQPAAASCRKEFGVKLALLSNQWQGVVRRAQQRRGIIDSLLRQWQRFRELQEKLSKWLQDVSPPAEAPGGRVPLQQARCRLEAVQVRAGLMEPAEPRPLSPDLLFHS